VHICSQQIKIFLNLTKDIYKNPSADIRIDGKRLNVFLLRSGARQEGPLYHFYSNYGEGFGQCNEARKRNLMIVDWKGRGKTSLFPEDMIIYVEVSY
jgi:hypothetical protein